MQPAIFVSKINHVQITNLASLWGLMRFQVWIRSKILKVGLPTRIPDGFTGNSMRLKWKKCLSLKGYTAPISNLKLPQESGTNNKVQKMQDNKTVIEWKIIFWMPTFAAGIRAHRVATTKALIGMFRKVNKKLWSQTRQDHQWNLLTI